MFKWLDALPWIPLIVLALLVLLAPFRPMPHVVEKIVMLKNGALTRPIDLFDLLLHLFPTFLTGIKAIRQLTR
ncbi:MAG: hypothetical protein VR64_16425 [Desulfatitalea sp. BRH_c12]|nr:MAG: hypothetical protein VR64_16425 [Desulfatitalea sp. BRH_c12]